MQTFLPYPDFAQSARCLDRQRLGKQRVEVLQILNAIHGVSTGWRNHAATRMWRHSVGGLVEYGLAVCDEWVARGYRDTCRDKISVYAASTPLPVWLGRPDFHLSHQSNLVRKNPKHYRKFFPGVPDDLPYVWPEGDQQ